MDHEPLAPVPAGIVATVTYLKPSRTKGTSTIRLRLEDDHLIECRVSLFTSSVAVDGVRVTSRWGSTIAFTIQDAGTPRSCVLVTSQGEDGWPAVVPRVRELVVDGDPVHLTHGTLRDG